MANNNFTSTSGGRRKTSEKTFHNPDPKAQQTLTELPERLAPYKLSAKDYAEFSASFFPRSGAKKKIDTHTIATLWQSLANFSLRLNLLQYWLSTSLVARSSYSPYNFDTLNAADNTWSADPARLQKLFGEHIPAQFSQLMATETPKQASRLRSNYANSLKEYLLTGPTAIIPTLVSGNNHIIKYNETSEEYYVDLCSGYNSPRNHTLINYHPAIEGVDEANSLYKGTYVGVRDHSDDYAAGQFINPTRVADSDNTFMTRFDNSSRAQPSFVKVVHSYMQSVLRSLFGDQVLHPSSGYLRVINAIPLNEFGPQKIVKLVIPGLGKSLSQIFSGLPSVPKPFDTSTQIAPELLRLPIAKYVDVLVIREPPLSRVDDLTKLLEKTHDHKLLGDLLSPQPAGPKFNDVMELLNTQVHFSLRLRIPQKFAYYVTQTPPNSKISLDTLNTWVLQWMRSAFLASYNNTAVDTEQAAGRPSKSGKKPKNANKGLSRVPGLDKISDYSLPPSIMGQMFLEKKRSGYYTEVGRVNEDNIFVNYNGTLRFLPKIDYSDVESSSQAMVRSGGSSGGVRSDGLSSGLAYANSERYEQAYEQFLQNSFSYERPLCIARSESVGNYYRNLVRIYEMQATKSVVGFSGYDKVLYQAAKQLLDYAGRMRAFDWNTNTVLTIPDLSRESHFTLSDANSKNFKNLFGVMPCDDLVIADYLGYGPPSNTHHKKVNDSLEDLFPDREDLKLQRRMVGGEQIVLPIEMSRLLRSRPIGILLDSYDYWVSIGAVPDLPILFDLATKEMITLLKSYKYNIGKPISDRDVLTNVQLNPWDVRPNTEHLYVRTIDANFGILNRNALRSAVIYELLEAVFDNLKLRGDSTLFKISGESDQFGVLDAIGDSDPTTTSGPSAYLGSHYFSTDITNAQTDHYILADFKNIYNFWGGRVFSVLCREILKIPHAKLLVITDTNTVAADSRFKLPTFEHVSKYILPMATVFGKYIPNSETYRKSAEKLYATDEDSMVTVDPTMLELPGFDSSRKKLMAHQFKTLSKLLVVKPARAVLDCQPGGGKTPMTICEILLLSLFEQRNGGELKPIVICPANLVRQWCEEVAEFTGGSWNAIPLYTALFDFQEMDGSVISKNDSGWDLPNLDRVIGSAPPNTIFVASQSFLTTKKVNLIIGNVVREFYSPVEFLSKFKFNYVAIDESHLVKNATSLRHAAAKTLAQFSFVKYVRLLTGTLINNSITDIVGQASIFNPAIFRTAKDFVEKNFVLVTSAVTKDYSKPSIETYRVSRERIGSYALMLTVTRKEWAYVLPDMEYDFRSVPLGYNYLPPQYSNNRAAYEQYLGLSRDSGGYGTNHATRPDRLLDYVNSDFEKGEFKFLEGDDLEIYNYLEELYTQAYDAMVAHFGDEMETLKTNLRNDSSLKKKYEEMVKNANETDDDDDPFGEYDDDEDGKNESDDVPDRFLIATYQKLERLITSPGSDPIFREHMFKPENLVKYKVLLEKISKRMTGSKWLPVGKTFMDVVNAAKDIDLEELVPDSAEHKEAEATLATANRCVRLAVNSLMIPPKIRETVDIVVGHFTHKIKQSDGKYQDNTWKSNKVYNQLDAQGIIIPSTNECVVRASGSSTVHRYLLRTKLLRDDGTALLDSEGKEQPITNYSSSLPPERDWEHWKYEPMGKLIVLCTYKRNVDAVYNALPEFLRRKAVRFYSDNPNVKDDLNRFQKTALGDPNSADIIIAIEKTIKEGLNVQLASRIVRVDIPWTPGDFEQSSSRIFRPDPRSFDPVLREKYHLKRNEMFRSMIHVHFTITDFSIEVPKMGRLMYKLWENSRFYQPEVESVWSKRFREPHPAPEKYTISLKWLKKPYNLYGKRITGGVHGDINAHAVTNEIYLLTCFQLAQIEDFQHYRIKHRNESYFIDVPPTPVTALNGADTIKVLPRMPSQIIHDANRDVLVLVGDHLAGSPQLQSVWSGSGSYANKTKLLFDHVVTDLTKNQRGLVVHTEFGYGVIIHATFRKIIGDDGIAEISSVQPIAKAVVQLLDYDSTYLTGIASIIGSKLLVVSDPQRRKVLLGIASSATALSPEQVRTRKTLVDANERETEISDAVREGFKSLHSTMMRKFDEFFAKLKVMKDSAATADIVEYAPRTPPPPPPPPPAPAAPAVVKLREPIECQVVPFVINGMLGARLKVLVKDKAAIFNGTDTSAAIAQAGFLQLSDSMYRLLPRSGVWTDHSLAAAQLYLTHNFKLSGVVQHEFDKLDRAPKNSDNGQYRVQSWGYSAANSTRNLAKLSASIDRGYWEEEGLRTFPLYVVCDNMAVNFYVAHKARQIADFAPASLSFRNSRYGTPTAAKFVDSGANIVDRESRAIFEKFDQNHLVWDTVPRNLLYVKFVPTTRELKLWLEDLHLANSNFNIGNYVKVSSRLAQLHSA